MELLPILIVANPYEAELCRRALADTGLEIKISEGGDELEALIAGGAMLFVVATGLYMSEPDEVINRARAAHPSVPIFLIADDEHELGGLSVAKRFYRPFDAEQLAHAIEQVAVAAEKAAGDIDDQPDIILEEEVTVVPELFVLPTSSAPPVAVAPVPRVPTEVAPMFPREPTEPIVDGPAAAQLAIANISERPTPAYAGTSDPDAELSSAIRTLSLMRADEALLDALGPLELQPMTVSPPPEKPAWSRNEREDTARFARLSDSSVRARKLSTELGRSTSAASLGIERGDDAYGAALDDIDLDSLDVASPAPAVRTATSAITAIPDDNGTSVGTNGNGKRWDEHEDSPSGPTLAVGGTGNLSNSTVGGELPEEQGDLSYVDVAALLARLLHSRYSGRLFFYRSDGDKSLYFEDGTPIAASSSFASDRLIEILHRDGKINREQLTRARPVAVAGGKAGADELVSAGMLKQREMFSLLRRHTEEVFYSLFSWESGSYQLRNESSPVDDRVRPGQSAWMLVLEGIRRKYGLERLLELVGPSETVLRPTTLLAILTTEVTLSEAERMAIGLFDGERTLGDVLAAMRGVRSTPLGEAGLYALAWWLLAAGALTTSEEGDLHVASNAVPTQVTPLSLGRVRERRQQARHGEPPDHDSDAERAIERERIVAKLDQLAEADYFMLLGVERHATTHEIRRAYERLRADFLPDRFSPSIRGELGEQLSEIVAVLGEALRVLSDEALRSSYRSHLVD